MNIEGKTKAVKAWLETYPELDGYLKLNATELESGERSFDTVTNDESIREYINGTKERAFTFALVMVADWSSGFDSTNADALEWGERWLDWCAHQYDAGNLPDFGEGATILDIEPLQNVPGLAAAYQSEQLARYLFQVRILYRE